MIDLIPLHRGVEEWRLDLLERDGATHVATLDMVEGSGSDTWQGGRETPHSMSCQLGSEPPRLRGRLLRATYITDGVPYVLGTWVPQQPKGRLTEADETWSLGGVDTTARLAAVSMRQRLTFPTGTPVAETVRGLVADYADGLPVVVQDDDETLRTPLTYDAGKTTLLSVANALLRAAGHSALRPSLDGTLMSSRLAPASERPVRMEWRDDLDAAPFEPDLELPGEDPDLPNEVIAIAPGGSSSPGLVGYWSDPASIALYGRQSTTIQIEATSQQSANDQARAHGLAPRAAAKELAVKGPWQPISGGDVARLVWAGKDVQRVAELTGKRSTWAPGMDTVYTLEAQ